VPQMVHVPQQQVQPPSQQNNSVGDDLNFDPTAIIGDDESATNLDVSRCASTVLVKVTS